MKTNYIIIRYKTWILLAVFVLLFTTCKKSVNNTNLSPNDFDEIKDKGKLIAITQYNSTDYFIYRGEPMGYQFELLQELADYLNLKFEVIVKNDLDENFKLLEKGSCDLIAINLTVNKPRDQKYSFTKPFSQTRQVLVQRKSTTNNKVIRNQIELGGKTIYVRKRSAYVHRLNNLSEEIGTDITIVEIGEHEDEQLIKMVASGEIDYTVCDEHVARVAKKFFHNIDIETPVSFPQSLAWAVRKDSPILLDTINSWIENFKEGKIFSSIYDKYYNNHYIPRIIKSDFFANTSGKVSVYDNWIKEHSRNIDWDWRLLASLIYQESRFKPDAQSWAGAFGLMQLMPRTAEFFGVSIMSSPKEQIAAGVNFIKWLDDRFEDHIMDKEERVKFILASYNAGYGHVSDARKLAKKFGMDPNKWDNNVDYFVLNKSKPEFYKDPEVKYGYCRGEETYAYVSEILERYKHYKNILD